ncbi:tyrosine-type recombinase/integrase [Streptobacillus moniliformis]|uniref:tyrosine-type recombinase/integrase n=1 Tax=Streptobacillus moniliformis TaxID=34105 RepID=UPI0007E40ED7|nr:site-specific integrase [Streptobacillus moniliformis]
MKNPNGFGSIVKLSGKRRRPYGALVTLGFDDNGKQIRKFIGYSETFKGANKLLLDYSDNPNMFNNNYTVKEVYDKWSETHFEKLTDSGIIHYKTGWNKCTSLYNLNIKDVKLSHIQNVIDTCGGYYASKKQLKTLLRQIFKYALKHDYIAKDYTEFLDIGKPTVRNLRVPFSDKEIEKLWKHEHLIYGIDTILILIYTGFRIGELIDIKCGDVNLEQGYIIGGKKTEAGTNRLVPINSKIKKLIEIRMENRKPEDKLITTKTGLMIKYNNYLEGIFTPIMQKLEMKHRIHDTRHTFATLLSNSDVNPTSIKKLIGHSSYLTTEKIYTHKNIDELKKAIEKI